MLVKQLHREPDLDVFVKAGVPGKHDRILDLGWEGDCLCAQGIHFPVQVHFVTDDIRTVRVCENTKVITADVFEQGIEDRYSLIFYRPVQRAAKEQVFDWINRAFSVLKVGGKLCLAGRRDRGVKSYLARIEAVFGNVEKVGQAGRTHIYRAHKTTEKAGVDPVETVYEFLGLDDIDGPYSFCAKAGVFSRDGIDVGSRFLVEHLMINPNDRILDMGCGYGLLGIVCARLAPQGRVRMVDVSFRAVQCAKLNIQKNQIQNAIAVVADGYENCGDQAFDLIVSNPPFHEGNVVGHAFIDGAREHLSDNGRLMMVVMRPEPYRRRMQKKFKHVQAIASRDGYTILCASANISF